VAQGKVCLFRILEKGVWLREKGKRGEKKKDLSFSIDTPKEKCTDLSGTKYNKEEKRRIYLYRKRGRRASRAM